MLIEQSKLVGKRQKTPWVPLSGKIKVYENAEKMM